MTSKFRMRPVEDLNELRDDDLIVVQFTGLFDKNGIPIFEDDILEWADCYTCSCGRKVKDDPQRGYVQMWGGSWCVSPDELGYEHFEPQHLNEWAIDRDEEYHNYYLRDDLILKEVEVIGNRWENPELLVVPYKEAK